MARLFNDSKTFVDMRMSHNPEDVLTAFSKLGPNPDRKSLENFVRENFHPPGKDLVAWTPPDWKDNPSFVDHVVDKHLKLFGSALNRLWKKLGRKINTIAQTFPNRSSLIVVDKPFIVPGGRFREFYYWDTFWIVEGLLVCQMHQTARSMIDNFVQLVKQFGFVPNGGRIYYLSRSQPPFLIPIVDLYLKATEDFEYVKTILPYLAREYQFWNANRSVQVNISGNVYILNQYAADMNTPRPESYYEDVHTASGRKGKAQAALYQDLASAAESGWDFSTRWFNKTSASLASIRTRRVVPVDLNAVLFRNELTLESFYKRAKDSKKAEEFNRLAASRRRAMEAVLWDEDKGTWHDYDLDAKSTIYRFYASNVVPLWAGLHQGNVTRDQLVVHAFMNMKVLDYPGGVPTSRVNSGQQWDFPNAWAPLQYFFQEGMANSASDVLQKLALDLAQKWIKTNYRAWNSTKHMFEKYDARVQGTPGGGGEYDIQVGFGWTNGVALHLLKRYPTQLKAVEENRPNPSSKAPILLIHHLVLFLLWFTVAALT
ncbi:hypothetical protein QZH41_004708 [Actinostola sp. cb2023]|nr:hypothetical protein QZH41_004708 [Actinostola sp. cb2023]